MTTSKIEWTGRTWNPVTGCTHISPGCRFCYAERMAERLARMGNRKYANGFRPTLHWDLLFEPPKWKKPQTIFVCSMSDLFQDAVPDEFIRAAFTTMRTCDHHTFQVLTKRSRRQREIAQSLSDLPDHPHIWVGVSVEDRKFGLPRLDHLRETPAAVRFLSVEPLLEDLGEIDLDDIDWVIVGGESGPRARPMRPDWARSIRDQCAAAGVPFFFKQWGGVNKKKAGRELDGRIHDAMPLHPRQKLDIHQES